MPAANDRASPRIKKAAVLKYQNEFENGRLNRPLTPAAANDVGGAALSARRCSKI